jgi:competence protein ComEC
MNRAEVKVTGHTGSLNRSLGTLRLGFSDRLATLFPGPPGQFLLGILLGQRDGLPDDLTQAFQRTGTTHVLALSGYNTSLVLGLVIAVLGRRPAAVVASLGVLACFVVMVGPAASVLRAALMGGFLLLGRVFGRPQAAGRALLVTAAGLLLVRPWSLRYDVGFDLSFLATAGILYFEPPLAHRFRRLPGFCRDALAVTLAAGLPTMPVIAGVFGLTSLIAPLANLVVVPLVPVLMAAGAGVTLISFISEPLAHALAAGPAALTGGVLGFIHLLGNWPVAAIDVSTVRAPVAVALALLAAGLAYRWRGALTQALGGAPAPAARSGEAG